jgi:hypothetical protein
MTFTNRNPQRGHLLLVLGLLLASPWEQASAQGKGGFSRPVGLTVDTEYVSPGPAPASVLVRGDMHACARRTTQTNPHVPGYFEGAVVVGFDAPRNQLICAGRMQLGIETPSPVTADPVTRIVECPQDQYVTGVRADRLEVLCAPLFNFNTRAAQALPTLELDPRSGQAPTVRSGMHACPSGYGLVGFDASSSAWTFQCRRFPICWASYGSVVPTYRTPCAKACVLPADAKAGQGVCS